MRMERRSQTEYARPNRLWRGTGKGFPRKAWVRSGRERPAGRSRLDIKTVMKISGIIPARFASTRFPGKPLFLIAGKPLIQHVVERCRSARSLSEVIVATDDARI